MELDPCRLRLPEIVMPWISKRLPETATPQISKRMPETKRINPGQFKPNL
jgi:hypothetical protein